MNKLLTPEEINYQIKYVQEHNNLPLEVTVSALCESVAQAQHKKTMDAVLKWLREPCDKREHYAGTLIASRNRFLCPQCMEELWQ